MLHLAFDSCQLANIVLASSLSGEAGVPCDLVVLFPTRAALIESTCSSDSWELEDMTLAIH
jgi:hypothetical protein